MLCIKDASLFSCRFPLAALYEVLKDTRAQSTHIQAYRAQAQL